MNEPEIRAVVVAMKAARKEAEDAQLDAIIATHSQTLASTESRRALMRAAIAADRALQDARPVARVAEVHMSRHTVEWTDGAMSEGTPLYAHLPQPDAQLCKFYDVTTFPELVWAMEDHILKLQEKVRELRVLDPNWPKVPTPSVREG